MVKRLATAMLAVVLLSAAGWYGWQLGPWADTATKEYGVPIDFASLERKASPNQYLIAPDGATPRAKPDAGSPVFGVAPDRLRDAFLAVVSEAPRTKLLNQSADGLRLSLVQRSAVLRFPDYIDVSILPRRRRWFNHRHLQPLPLRLFRHGRQPAAGGGMDDGPADARPLYADLRDFRLGTAGR